MSYSAAGGAAAEKTFVVQTQPNEKLAKAVAWLKEHEATNDSPPQIGDTFNPSWGLNQVYAHYFARGITDALKDAGLSQSTAIADVFKGIKKKDVQPRDVTEFFNKHTPSAFTQITPRSRLPHTAVALGPMDKKLLHAAQNFGYHHARCVVSRLKPFMNDDHVDIAALREQAAHIYSEARKRGPSPV